MPINVKYKARYEFGASYHVFNRTSAKQLMFRTSGNHFFFLEKFNQYLGNFVELLSWCLIPNHFHFLIRVKHLEDMPLMSKNRDIHEVITRQFKNFFICYSVSYKRMFNLSGNVFAQKYKHIRLYTEKDVIRTVLYIHRNPLHHDIGDWQQYLWSSYRDISCSYDTNQKAAFVLGLFGGREAFEKAHLESFGQGSEPS